MAKDFVVIKSLPASFFRPEVNVPAPLQNDALFQNELVKFTFLTLL